jgi:predicted small secreted protein
MTSKREPAMTKRILIALSFSILLSACNTVQGVGEDIKGAGEWTADSAEKVKKKID